MAREARAYTRIGALAGGVGSVLAVDLLTPKPEPERHPGHFEVISLDDSPFEKHPGGEFTPEERAERMETLEHGEVIFHDIGLDFYEMTPEDTSVLGIKAKLAKYPQYSYLTKQNRRLVSFNVSDEDLPNVKEIPIPQKNAERRVSDEDFSRYAHRAIAELKLDPAYKAGLERILRKVSEDELVASMIAVAKQESGKEHIGDFEQHLYQANQHTFSYSYYHVLDNGAGLRARQHLEMTRGQTYHPLNASKLFLAFLIEKSQDSETKLGSLFPLDQHAEAFAVFYNGKYFKPEYTENLREYYTKALDIL